MANSNGENINRPISDANSCICWLNTQLASTDISVTDLREDLADGKVLATLANILAEEQVVDVTKRSIQVIFITNILSIFSQRGLSRKLESPSIFIEGDVKAIVEFFKEVEREKKRAGGVAARRKAADYAGNRWNVAQKLKQEEQATRMSKEKERQKKVEEEERQRKEKEMQRILEKEKEIQRKKEQEEELQRREIEEIQQMKKQAEEDELSLRKEPENNANGEPMAKNHSSNKEEAPETLANKEETLETLANKEETLETLANKEEVDESSSESSSDSSD